MSAAALDRTLAILVAAQLVTGLLTLRAGSPPTAVLFVVHGVLAGALLAAVVLKLWRSVPKAASARRWAPLGLALLLGFFALAALLGGFAWVASGRILTLGPWTVLTLHAWAALVLLPIAVVHLLPRRWRVLRPPRGSADRPVVTRRTALGALGLGVIGVVGWLTANTADVLLGGMRRFTGSRWRPEGGVPPATTFFGEATPKIDHATWRLTVAGSVERPLSLSLDELHAMGEVDQEAVLDCTSGWALRTTWRGVALGSLLERAAPDPRARSVRVLSSSGWYAELPLSESAQALLATGVAGAPLPAANGAPCRLVAPGRRGLEWVKWVERLEVS